MLKSNKISFRIASFGIFKLSGLLIVSLVLILDHDSSKLVNGQLEAVGAVLSVVPVTSILATAGLVGVKLAALSRLLHVLGYDRAYLANGGSGTAAEPIGLQTNYAYMFPYVPGLNISVRGDHSSQYQNQASSSQQQQQQQKDSGYSATRKTFPSMSIPGDYESQNRPFRGSETLREIFKNSGIDLRFPTTQQQQQIFNTFPGAQGNIGKAKIENVSPNFQNNNNQQFATTPTVYHQTFPPPATINNNVQNNSPQSSNNNILNPHSSSAALISVPTSVAVESVHSAQQHSEPNKPSFSSSQPQGQPGPPPDKQQPQGRPQSAHRQPASSVGHNSPENAHQVNMPHPSNIKPPKPAPAPLPLPSPPISKPPEIEIEVEIEPAAQGGLQSAEPPKQRLHPVPQHDYFYNKYKERQRQQLDSQRRPPPPPLPSGQLVQVPAVALSKPPSSFEDYESIFGPSAAAAAAVTSAMPSNTNGIGNPIEAGPTPNDISTNIIPLTSATDGPPPFHDDMDQNEFNLVNRRRRRRRKRELNNNNNNNNNDHNVQLNLETRASLANMIMSAGPAAAAPAPPPTKSWSQERELAVKPEPAVRTDENFGMPALNIYPSFRRKRGLREKILKLSLD